MILIFLLRNESISQTINLKALRKLEKQHLTIVQLKTVAVLSFHQINSFQYMNGTFSFIKILKVDT